MYKNSRRKVLIPIIISVSTVVGLILGIYIQPNKSSDQASQIVRSIKGDKISYLSSLIANYYVDSISMDSIAEKVIPQMLAELDPHSTYISAKDLEGANEALDGEFDGIGVVFNMMTDTVVVLNVISGGPSFKAGVIAGDRIIKVSDKTIAGVGMSQDSVVKMLRGPRGTEVELDIERIGIQDLIPISVTRGVIPIKSLDASFMLKDGVGFVKLSRFSRSSFNELIVALSELKAAGMKSLIFDLRGNSGGFLDQAIRIANEFLESKKLIVYTEDRDRSQSRQYSNGAGNFSDIDLTILIDESSASSSEILAGAMQDNDRAVIIGRRSFGKGLVQEQVPLGDGSAVRLTVARYFTPTGRSIQKPYSSGDDYDQDLMNRYLHDEMFNADSIRFDSTLRYTTPAGRIVYGGGGIMPDIFVPADTTHYSKSMQEVLAQNLLYRFALDYSDKHRDELNAITTIKELDDFYAKNSDLLDSFIAYIGRKSIYISAKDMARDKDLLIAQLKAIVGRNTELEDSAFYYYIAEIDKVINEALKN